DVNYALIADHAFGLYLLPLDNLHQGPVASRFLVGGEPDGILRFDNPARVFINSPYSGIITYYPTTNQQDSPTWDLDESHIYPYGVPLTNVVLPSNGLDVIAAPSNYGVAPTSVLRWTLESGYVFPLMFLPQSSTSYNGVCGAEGIRYI